MSIQDHNTNGDQRWKLGLTCFSDWSQEEFKKILGAVVPKRSPIILDETDTSKVGEGADINWTTLNRVSGVKNQGNCGACWAFSAIGAVESQYAIRDVKAADDYSE